MFPVDTLSELLQDTEHVDGTCLPAGALHASFPPLSHCQRISPLCRTMLCPQVYALRELHEELTALLSQEEAAALGLGSSFAPFARLAALHVSEFTGAAWATAAAEHERRLEVVEARISQKLKELFGEQSHSLLSLPASLCGRFVTCDRHASLTCIRCAN